jgi:predicted nucleic acid-binding protein
VSRLVVDASVAVKWFVPEELSGAARRWLQAEHELLAPDLLWAELGNVLWKKHRRRELEQPTAIRLFRDFTRIPVQSYSSRHWAGAALALAVRHGVTVYDGLYLALAVAQQCRLVTADSRLHETCRGGMLRRFVAWVEEGQ